MNMTLTGTFLQTVNIPRIKTNKPENFCTGVIIVYLYSSLLYILSPFFSIRNFFSRTLKLLL